MEERPNGRKRCLGRQMEAREMREAVAATGVSASLSTHLFLPFASLNTSAPFTVRGCEHVELLHHLVVDRRR